MQQVDGVFIDDAGAAERGGTGCQRTVGRQRPDEAGGWRRIDVAEFFGDEAIGEDGVAGKLDLDAVVKFVVVESGGRAFVVDDDKRFGVVAQIDSVGLTDQIHGSRCGFEGELDLFFKPVGGKFVLSVEGQLPAEGEGQLTDGAFKDVSISRRCEKDVVGRFVDDVLGDVRDQCVGFAIGQVIGDGGFGEVFLYVRPGVLHDGVSEGAEVDRFEFEARSLGQVQSVVAEMLEGASVKAFDA